MLMFAYRNYFAEGILDTSSLYRAVKDMIIAFWIIERRVLLGYFP